MKPSRLVSLLALSVIVSVVITSQNALAASHGATHSPGFEVKAIDIDPGIDLQPMKPNVHIKPWTPTPTFPTPRWDRDPLASGVEKSLLQPTPGPTFPIPPHSDWLQV